MVVSAVLPFLCGVALLKNGGKLNRTKILVRFCERGSLRLDESRDHTIRDCPLLS